MFAIIYAKKKTKVVLGKLFEMFGSSLQVTNIRYFVVMLRELEPVFFWIKRAK